VGSKDGSRRLLKYFCGNCIPLCTESQKRSKNRHNVCPRQYRIAPLLLYHFPTRPLVASEDLVALEDLWLCSSFRNRLPNSLHKPKRCKKLASMQGRIFPRMTAHSAHSISFASFVFFQMLCYLVYLLHLPISFHPSSHFHSSCCCSVHYRSVQHSPCAMRLNVLE